MLAETIIAATKTLLESNLASELNIKAYYTSERSLEAVQNYPCIFVLCPGFVVNQYFSDYIDATYNLVVGSIVLNQDTEALRSDLNKIIEEIIKTLIRHEDGEYEYTIVSSAGFNVNFGPIFTSNNESFIADAQVSLQAKRKVAETW